MNKWERIYPILLFTLISLILFGIVAEKRVVFVKIFKNFPYGVMDPKMKGLFVPPAEDSHPKSSPQAGRLLFPNTWENLPPDNNIPGLLPGPRVGETLGLEHNLELSLQTPIKAPLLDNYKPNICKTEGEKLNKLKECMLQANSKSKFTSMPASMYYKYRFYQCSPYNGSYCQCTNNYIPLPPVGLCQENGYNEDVCPDEYRVKPSEMYMKTINCLEKQFYKLSSK